MRYLCDGLSDQPEPQPPELETAEKFGEVFKFFIFFFSWAQFTYEYDGLDDEVPIAFDLDGNTKDLGNKKFLFAFPAIHTCIYVLLTALGRYPQYIKYPILESLQNKQILYLYGRKLILYFKIISSFLFIYLTFAMIDVVRKEYSPENMYNCFAFILLYIPALIYFFRKCRQLEVKYEDQRKNTINCQLDPAEIIIDRVESNKIQE